MRTHLAGMRDMVTGTDSRTRFRLGPAIGITVVAIAGVTALALHLYEQVAAEMLARYQREQGIVASQQAARLDMTIRDVTRDLVAMSRHPGILGLEEPRVRPLLSAFYARHRAFIVACSYMDEEGVLRMVEGADTTGEGSDIRGQPHVVKLFERGKPVVSGSFLAVQGYFMVAIHVPILRDGVVRGSVAASVKWDAFESWFRAARTSPGSFSALLDPAGRVIYHPEDRFIGEDLARIPTRAADGRLLPSDYFGVDHSDVVTGPFFGDGEQVIAVKTFEVDGDPYAVVVSAPYADVMGPVSRFSILLALLAGIALLVMAASSAYLVVLFYRDRRQATRFRAELESKIEEIRRAEERLRLFREVFVHSRDAIAIADADGRLLERNDAHAALTGFSAEEFGRGTPAAHLGDAVYADLRRGLETEGAFHREVDIRTRSGESRTVDLSAFTVPGRDGEETYHVGISRDVTERKRAERERARLEDQLRQADKLRAIGQLAGGIAHDFNNQLTGILGYAELLRNGLQDPRRIEAAEMILQAGGRAADLTQQLLAYARKGRQEAVAVDLHAVVEEVASILSRSLDKRIRIVCELAAERHVVTGDPTQIQNAVLNLALNARDAMPDGGELRFSTSVHSLGEFAMDSMSEELEPGPYLSLTVADTGTGIPDDIRDRIFEPFFTTKDTGEGTGMGLAAVYGTVTGHHGAIDVTSSPGGGTAVVVHLPLTDDPVEARAEPDAPLAGHAHVLVVDDEELVLGLVSSMLRPLGYRVTCCRSGAEGVERFRAEAGSVDVVLLDLIMPEMGGRETFAALREIDPDVRVVLFTGFSTDGEARQLLDAGASALVPKPFRLTELTQALSEAVG